MMDEYGINRWMDEWMNVMDGWMDEYVMDGWMDGVANIRWHDLMSSKEIRTLKDTYKWFQQKGAAAVCRRARRFQDVQGPIAALSLSSVVGMNATAAHVRSFRMSGSEEELRLNVQS